MKKKFERSSEILKKIENNNDLSGEITFQRILDTLGNRAIGIGILFFSLAAALPLSAIPGYSLIFSIPIIIFAVQLIIGRDSMWLPEVIAQRTIHHEKIDNIIRKTVPYLEKAEYFMKPRLPILTSDTMTIVNGLSIVCLAVLMMMPIPLSNFIFALLLVMFSMGLIEKDGLLILLGYLIAIVYLSLVYMVLMSAIRNLLT